MKFFVRAAVVAALLCSATFLSTARADAVRKPGNARILGTVKSVTATEVSIEVSGMLQKIPVTEVEAIEFDGEPIDMKNVRSVLKTGGDQRVLETLQRINPATLSRKELKQDYEFYAAEAKARLALRNAGSVRDAGTAIHLFVQGNPDSYHFYAAQERLGELLVRDNNINAAMAAFTTLEQAPFDEYKMRAGVARGRALMSQEKYAEALAAFDQVLALNFDPVAQKGTPSETQRFAAVLGRAQCQAGTEKYDEAIAQLENEIIPKLAAEDAELQARAYVTLGNCYIKKPNGKKAALLAFLHVDVLYDSVAEAHAEALWNLSNLWVELGKTERAQDCQTRLSRLYPQSPWLSRRAS